jgi:phage gp36-like protein
MSETLRPTNFDAINIVEITEATADIAASQAVANVKNAQGFVADDFYVTGELGAELSEMLQLDSKSGNALTGTSNYLQAHVRGDRITKLFGNQIKLYRATNVDGSVPDDDDFSVLDTVTIEPDQSYTEYTDSIGGSGYWYKKTYYNSVSGSETNIANSTAVRGGGYGGYVTWEEVRGEAGLTQNRWIEESVYQEKLDLAQGEVNASLSIGGYTLPLTSVPAIVKNATLLLAAGYVLTRDYGVSSSGTTKDGELKIKQARAILARIESGEESVVDGTTGAVLSQSNKVSGYPNTDGSELSPSEARMFGVNRKF